MILNKMTNKEYRDIDAVSSSVLKSLLVSEKHYENIKNNGWKKSDSMILGDAVHAFILEPERFNASYTREVDVYKRKTGSFEVGDAKLDENGKPIAKLVHAEDSSMDIKGEQLNKFEAMIAAYSESEDAQNLLKGAKHIEESFITDYNGLKLKVRDDFITEDDFICDIKTVGSSHGEKPSSPENFSYEFFKFGYDLQMFMYYNVIKKDLPEIRGFKFLCLDATVPSGVQIYTFINGESEWFELGGHRFKSALERYRHFIENKVHKVYDNEVPTDLPLCYKAEQLLVEYRDVQ